LDSDKVYHGFKTAYREVSEEMPCFGGPQTPSKDWWRQVVLRSFDRAGFTLPPDKKERIFQRIYSIFGSHRSRLTDSPNTKKKKKKERKRKEGAMEA